MSAQKEELRKKYKKARLLMGRWQVEENSVLICRNLYSQVDWSQIKTVCTYQSIARLNEVDVYPLLETLAYKHKNIKVYKLGNERQQKIPKRKFDLIIVPVLAFDKSHHRLGWGGGFYDRFLVTQPQAIKVGLSFTNSFVKKGLPHEPHDIPLDKVITEV
jgi:5-formyltetrahydrofolate cyclo-ligase